MKSNDQKFKELVKDYIRTEGFRAKVDQCLMSLGGFGSWVVLWLGLCFFLLAPWPLGFIIGFVPIIAASWVVDEWVQMKKKLNEEKDE